MQRNVQKYLQVDLTTGAEVFIHSRDVCIHYLFAPKTFSPSLLFYSI
jgi:hypothetical protein